MLNDVDCIQARISDLLGRTFSHNSESSAEPEKNKYNELAKRDKDRYYYCCY